MVKDCHSRHHSNKKRCNKLTLKGCQPETTVLNRNTLQVPQVKREENDGWSTGRCDNTSTSKNPSSTKPFKRIIRRNNFDKILMTKKRIIKMLFVVVMEFFICWTPLYLFNTISQFHPKAAYKALGSTGISLIQLLAYVSSCCNPITYCFMHKKFRQGFLAVFGCRKKRRIPFGRDASGNNSFYFSSQSTLKTGG